MRKNTYIALLLLIPMMVNAQIRERVSEEKSEPLKEQQTDVKEKTDELKTEKILPDTVYCISIKKQHGWFAPVKAIDLETARKFGSYMMFTRRNALGHWTKMETFNGYGEPTWLGSHPYILDTQDPLGDQNWIDKIKTGCITEMVSDPTGNYVIQERQYDKDMNLIYAFSHVPIGENKYIGSYKDYYGFPAEMRKDSTQGLTYGTLVIIIEDRWGNDSIIEFVDSKGIPKNNYDGVGRSVYFHDEYGRHTGHGSSDHDGNLVIDNKGNCGWEYLYDNETGFIIEGYCMDQHWQPMPMPQNGMSDGPSTGVTRIVYKYDSFGRNLEEKYMTLDNRPDTNIYGTHKTEYTYNAFGDILSVTSYDINGKLAAMDESGAAKYIAEYDELGRCTYIEWYDKNNKLNSTPGYICSHKVVFGSDGLHDEEVYCFINEGEIDTSYYFKRDKVFSYTRNDDGSIRIDSIDHKGRTTLTAFYNADGSSTYEQSYGFHKEELRYLDLGEHKSNVIIKHFNANGELCGEYPFNQYIRDSLSYQELRFNYDEQKRLSGSFIMKFPDNISSHPLCEDDANGFGKICRAGGIAAVRHYHANVLYTQKNEFASFVGKDEFGEADYIKSVWGSDGLNEGLLYYYQIMRNGVNVFFDENNNVINDRAAFIDKCPKAMSIEITDSIGYAYGLKDNDIIIRYGDVYQMNDSLDYYTFIGAWTIAQVFESKKEKQLLLFRIDPETKEYGIVTTLLPQGNPSDLGFIAHPIFRTQKQRDRQAEAIENYCKQCRESNRICLWKNDLSQNKNSKNVIIAFPEMYRKYRYYPYPERVTDPTIIMAFSLPEINKNWLFGQDYSDFQNVINIRQNSSIPPTLSLYYVKDAVTLQQESFSENTIWAHFIKYQVSDAQYDQLQKLSTRTIKSIEKEEKNTAKNQINKKQLIGKWQTAINQDNAKANILLKLSNDELADATIVIDYDAMMEGKRLLLGLTISMKSLRWNIQGKVLSMVSGSNSEVNAEISKFDISGTDDFTKQLIKSYFEENKDELLKSSEFKNLVFNHEEYRIKDITKDELKLYDGQTEIVFHKVK